MTTLRVLCAVAVIAAAGCKKSDEGKEPAKTDKAGADDKAGAKTTDTAKPPGDAPKTAADPKLIERGAYLAGIMGCPQCHTPLGPKGPIMEKAFAGGLEIPEVFGTWRSPNITQDKKTGIGDWTDEQILALVRTGVRPNGDRIYPVMPYMFYNVLSDDDGKALVAFLRSIPAMENAVEGTGELKLPKPEAPKPAGKAPGAEPVEQGRYLATLMHCAACHIPATKEGAPDLSKPFIGGFHFEIPFLGEGILYAPNITQDKKTGIGGWSDEEILTATIDMKKRDGTPILGPMMFYSATWANITDGDRKALLAFLRTIEGVENKVPTSTFKPKGPPPGGEGAPPAGHDGHKK